MGKRNLYLKTISLEEALEKYEKVLEKILTKKWETIPVTESLGRVTKEAVYAKYCSPLYNSAAMDGIGVITEKTKGATQTSPVELVQGEDFVPVDTGDPVHLPYDGVIMAEDLLETDKEDRVRITEAAAPWQHIRPVGEDIVAGEMILPGHHKIRAIDIGVLLSAGITEISVACRPSVAIFPTGTEMIEPGETPVEGSIIESNSRMFENMAKEQGAEAVRFSILPDDYDTIRDAVARAAKEYDMVVINAGSSAGREDYTVHVLRELGEVIVHGVAVKPGKPVILAVVNNRPVIGLPGYPVSAYIAFENFVSPVLAKMGDFPQEKKPVIHGVVTKRLVSSLKHREYVRVKVGKVGDKLVAAPLARGAGAAMSLVRADGFCIIPQNSEGLEAGEEAEIELYRDLSQIENTLVIIGSHDLILDIMADLMPEIHPGMFLSSTHVGSMGGLMALKRQEAHIAPVHLLDESTGVYNESYLKKMFPEPMALIKGVGRIQGLMVKPGNPLGITGISDLRKGRYVNRQRGAGTRILLDYLLGKEGISPDEISGYGCEASTHMAVAAQVAGEGADAGMGVYSAAKAMGLDFIPVGKESYDFALYKKDLDTPLVQAFLDILRSEAFHKKIEELGGYSWEEAGEIREIL